MAPPSVAILGSRGIPARFGGFETFAEELAVRLAAKGYAVTVVCEKEGREEPDSYRGVRLRYLRTPAIVGLRSMWFDFASLVTSIRRYDVIYMLGYHGAFAFWICRVFGQELWTNMDGLEWKRSKWSAAAKLYLRVMEWMAVATSSKVIGDAEAIRDRLVQAYGAGKKAYFIPYGANPVTDEPSVDPVRERDLVPGNYYLVVCRLEPENRVREIIEGFLLSRSTKVLAIVGDHRSGTRYVEELRALASDRVRFLGSIYDRAGLAALRSHCSAYFHGHTVGGTNPSLLEAMACGNFVIADDNPFNREVAGRFAWFFRAPADLAAQIDRLETSGVPAGAAQAARELLQRKYNWDVVADSYARLLDACARR